MGIDSSAVQIGTKPTKLAEDLAERAEVRGREVTRLAVSGRAAARYCTVRTSMCGLPPENGLSKGVLRPSLIGWVRVLTGEALAYKVSTILRWLLVAMARRIRGEHGMSEIDGWRSIKRRMGRVERRAVTCLLHISSRAFCSGLCSRKFSYVLDAMFGGPPPASPAGRMSRVSETKSLYERW